jgi:gliding motility-associated-like protein
MIDTFYCNFSETFKIKLVLLIPNVITPNGDGYNDVFKIVGLPEGTGIKIFDKNGTLIFDANEYNETNFWTGKDSRGIALETGNYWYILSNPESKLYKKGFIFLLR